MSKEEKKESAAQNKENTGSEMQTENQETPKTELQALSSLFSQKYIPLPSQS